MPLTTPKIFTGINTGKTSGAAVGTNDFDTPGLVGSNPPIYTDAEGRMWVDFSTLTTGTQSGMIQQKTAGDSPYFQLTYDVVFTALATVAHEASQGRINPTTPVKRLSVLHNISAGANTVLARGWTTTDAVLDGTGGTGLPVWTTGVATVQGAAYRVQIAAQRGAGTTDGKMKARLIRVSDSVQLAEGEDWALDLGTVAWSHHQSGKVGTAGNAPFRISRIAFSDQAYAYLPSPSDPVVTPPPDPTPVQTVHRVGERVRLGNAWL